MPWKVFLHDCSGTVGGGHPKDVTACWHGSWIQAIGVLLTLSPVLRMYLPPIIPIVGAISKMPPWESNMLLRPPEPNMSLYSVKVSIKILRFWQAGGKIYSSCHYPRQASYLSSLAYWNGHPPVGRGLPLSLVVSPNAPCMEDWGAPKVVN